MKTKFNDQRKSWVVVVWYVGGWNSMNEGQPEESGNAATVLNAVITP